MITIRLLGWEEEKWFYFNVKCCSFFYHLLLFKAGSFKQKQVVSDLIGRLLIFSDMICWTDPAQDQVSHAARDTVVIQLHDTRKVELNPNKLHPGCVDKWVALFLMCQKFLFEVSLNLKDTIFAVEVTWDIRL